MKKYRKKPLIVEAIQWDGYNNQSQMNALYDWGFSAYHVGHQLEDGTNRVDLVIHTLEGYMDCDVGHYIIKGINGEFYSCHPDVFEQTYEAVDERI